MDWYAYHSEIRDKDDRMQEFLVYKDYEKNIGSNYDYHDKFDDFKKHLRPNILQDLVNNYMLSSKVEKKTVRKLIDDLIAIKTVNSYKSRVLETLILLESICKYFVSKHKIVVTIPKGHSGYQERVKAVCKYLNIPKKNINFSYSNQKIKKISKHWHITKYRNQLAHADLEETFTMKYSRRECIKVLKLLRRLLFILLDSKHQDIPFPEINL